MNTKKARRIAVWILANGAMIAGLWFGLVEGVHGAKNIGLLLVWFAICTTPLYLVSEALDKALSEGGKHRPALDWTAAACVISLLAWHGYLWTAGFYVLYGLVRHGALALAVERATKEAP